VHSSGRTSSKTGGQGVRKAKCPEFGTTRYSCVDGRFPFTAATPSGNTPSPPCSDPHSWTGTLIAAKLSGVKEDGKRVGDHDGLDPRIMGEPICRELLVAELLADMERRSLAPSDGVDPIRIGPDQNQPRITTSREPEEADAFRIDLGSGGRRAHHEVNEPFDISRAFDRHGEIAGTAHIGDGIARMTDGGDDEAGVGEGLGGVVMADEVAAPTMRDDDQRQLIAGDRAVLNPGSVILPTTTSCGGIAQGDHTAPLIAGPSGSAGTSINPKPAASAAAAVSQMMAARTGLSGRMGRAIDLDIADPTGLHRRRRRGKSGGLVRSGP
jgi:hypothetical protein